MDKEDSVLGRACVSRGDVSNGALSADKNAGRTRGPEPGGEVVHRAQSVRSELAKIERISANINSESSKKSMFTEILSISLIIATLLTWRHAIVSCRMEFVGRLDSDVGWNRFRRGDGIVFSA